MSVDAGTWVFFLALVLGMLAVDLLSGRSQGTSTFRGALMWSGLWIALGVSFGLWVAWQFGRDAAVQYYGAYLLEKCLSVDNVFVFLIIFSELRIPPQHQPRVLLGGMIESVRFLRVGLALILAFVAAKMLSEGFIEIGAGLSVAVIAIVLSATVLASLLAPAKERASSLTGENAP